MRRIAIIGPESTGKSTLAAALADYFQCPWVPEFARNYLLDLNRPYEEHDLLKIALGQIAAEDQWMGKEMNPPPFLICDTELTVVKIWSEVKYGKVDPRIMEALEKRTYSHYLLTHIDLPWVPDPLREHPRHREELMNRYLKECEERNLPYTLIRGKDSERLEKAIKALKDLI
jgi:NadR type nicotinamide-nucleotide adenylyltransferase